MGLPDRCLVEGQDGHVAEFVCAVCFGLVDAPLLTMCNHIFCMACLQKWMDEKIDNFIKMIEDTYPVIEKYKKDIF